MAPNKQVVAEWSRTPVLQIIQVAMSVRLDPGSNPSWDSYDSTFVYMLIGIISMFSYF